MSKGKLFSIYDAKALVYTQPNVAKSTGEMLRWFEDKVNSTRHDELDLPIVKHPGDFTLFEIGEFDELTCEIRMLESKISLGSGNEFKRQQNTPAGLAARAVPKGIERAVSQ